MCGIVGYVGPNSTIDVLLGGLKRLEYRGYDSAGIAVLTDAGEMGTRKRAGKLGILSEDLGEEPLADGHTGIGHTRWATHGGPTDDNAHPHLGDDGKLALIHNGIIENFSELKQELLDRGAEFTSETDTEVAAIMVGEVFKETGDLTLAMQRVVSRLDGAFTLLVMHQERPGVVVGARRNSPLVIGLGEGENFLGSDVAAFVEHTSRAMEIGQDEIVTIRPDSVEVTDFAGNPVPTHPFEVAWDASAAEKGGWSSFMAKEISEEPEAVLKTILGRTRDGEVVIPELDVDGNAGPGLDGVLAEHAGVGGRAARQDHDAVDLGEDIAHRVEFRDRHGAVVHAAEQRLADRLGLLADLLLHEARPAALLGG